MRTVTVILLAGLTSPTGAASATAPVPTHLMKSPELIDRDRLQGCWKLATIHLGKDELRPHRGAEYVWEIRGDTLTVTEHDRTSTATMKVETKDGLKRLHLSSVRSVSQDGKHATERDVAFGLLLNGDKLTLARTTTAAEEMNTAVDPKKPESDTLLIVLTRVKDKDR